MVAEPACEGPQHAPGDTQACLGLFSETASPCPHCSLKGGDWGSSKPLSGFGDHHTCLHLYRTGAPHNGLVGGKWQQTHHQLVQPRGPMALSTRAL